MILICKFDKIMKEFEGKFCANRKKGRFWRAKNTISSILPKPLEQMASMMMETERMEEEDNEVGLWLVSQNAYLETNSFFRVRWTRTKTTVTN